jgi:hypothetical protein
LEFIPGVALLRKGSERLAAFFGAAQGGTYSFQRSIERRLRTKALLFHDLEGESPLCFFGHLPVTPRCANHTLMKP